MNAEPARHLHLVDTATGEAREVCHACMAKDEKLAAQARKITELRNEAENKVEKRPALDPQIMEVCLFHKRLLSPSWTIVRNKGAYNDVKDRLGKDIDAETGRPAFTVRHLRAASVGMSLSQWTRSRGIKSAAWLFGQTKHVEWMLDESITFRRETGVSALEIVDELAGSGLARLAAHCSDCGHMLLDHERQRPELDLFDPPCAVHGCACNGFDDRDWRAEMWLSAQDRRVTR